MNEKYEMAVAAPETDGVPLMTKLIGAASMEITRRRALKKCASIGLAIAGVASIANIGTAYAGVSCGFGYCECTSPCSVGNTCTGVCCNPANTACFTTCCDCPSSGCQAVIFVYSNGSYNDQCASCS